jgi:hypothetical protein
MQYNTHKRKTSMPPAGFEPVTPARKRPQNYGLDRAAIDRAFTRKIKPMNFGWEGARQACTKWEFNKML